MNSEDSNLLNKEIQDFFEPIIIRYDGLDAENHQVNLADFGKSAQGIAKIMATVATFTVTQNYTKGSKKLDCKITIGVAEENCYSIKAFIILVEQHPLLSATISTTAGGVFVVVFQYIWNVLTGKKEEMKHLRAMLELSIKELSSKADNSKMLETIDKMATGLISAAKDATKPIGNSCNTLKFATEKDNKRDYIVELDIEDKRAIGGGDIEVTPEESYRVLISELDMKNFTCKVSLVDDLFTRFDAKITDPQIELPDNGYVIAMAKKSVITIKAKRKIQQETTKQFIISDIENKDDKQKTK